MQKARPHLIALKKRDNCNFRHQMSTGGIKVKSHGLYSSISNVQLSILKRNLVSCIKFFFPSPLAEVSIRCLHLHTVLDFPHQQFQEFLHMLSLGTITTGSFWTILTSPGSPSRCSFVCNPPPAFNPCWPFICLHLGSFYFFRVPSRWNSSGFVTFLVRKMKFWQMWTLGQESLFGPTVCGWSPPW